MTVEFVQCFHGFCWGYWTFGVLWVGIMFRWSHILVKNCTWPPMGLAVISKSWCG